MLPHVAFWSYTARLLYIGADLEEVPFSSEALREFLRTSISPCLYRWEYQAVLGSKWSCRQNQVLGWDSFTKTLTSSAISDSLGQPTFPGAPPGEWPTASSVQVFRLPMASKKSPGAFTEPTKSLPSWQSKKGLFVFNLFPALCSGCFITLKMLSCCAPHCSFLCPSVVSCLSETRNSWKLLTNCVQIHWIAPRGGQRGREPLLPPALQARACYRIGCFSVWAKCNTPVFFP